MDKIVMKLKKMIKEDSHNSDPIPGGEDEAPDIELNKKKQNSYEEKDTFNELVENQINNHNEPADTQSQGHIIHRYNNLQESTSSVSKNTKQNKYNLSSSWTNPNYKFQKSSSEKQLYTSSQGIQSHNQSSLPNKKLQQSTTSSTSKDKIKNTNLISSSLPTSNATNEQNDPIISIITKTIAYIKKNKENISLDKLVDNLNEITEIHINSLNELRLKNKAIDKNNMIMQTKYNTAENMMKNFELKYLKAEKDKGKLTRQWEEITNEYNAMIEKNRLVHQHKQEMNWIEKNNEVWMKTNEKLKNEINEWNIKNDFIKKKCEEDIKEISGMLAWYHEKLIKIESKMTERGNRMNTWDNYEEMGFVHSKESQDKTMTLNTFQ